MAGARGGRAAPPPLTPARRPTVPLPYGTSARLPSGNRKEGAAPPMPAGETERARRGWIERARPAPRPPPPPRRHSGRGSATPARTGLGGGGAAAPRPGCASRGDPRAAAPARGRVRCG